MNGHPLYADYDYDHFASPVHSGHQHSMGPHGGFTSGQALPPSAGAVPSLSPTTTDATGEDGAGGVGATVESGRRGGRSGARRAGSAGDTSSPGASAAPSSANGGGGDYKKNKRFIMSREHLKWLKSVFEETPFPSAERMQQISEVVGMDKRQVRVWFQNRRAVEKRKTA
ncbi:hypothetical protein HDU83_001831 [Entophlyctis luteolus]|nr:hypothetical protein HDU82_004463 [Entophlyctis luteolus]KAJ3347779.1 hypothetical protein HDU83_001831 [Entophlyctis luteolus]